MESNLLSGRLMIYVKGIEMGLMEIVLIVIGLAAFVLGFLLPADRRGGTQSSVQIDEEDIRNVVEKEIEDAKSQISDIVDETITYAMEKTERSMDRLTNEKMLAVNEYSDTVLGEINKNHKEVVFLYDMLNDKHDSLKATVSEAIKADSEIKQVSKDAEITAREMLEKVREVQESVDEAWSNTKSTKAAGAGSTEKEPEAKARAVQRTEDESGFTPMTVREVEIVMPDQEASGGSTEAEERAENAEERSKPVRASSRLKEETVPFGMDSREGTSFSSSEAGNDSEKNNNDRILQLHKAGKSNMAIARELGLGIGEVKLVIDLFEGA